MAIQAFGYFKKNDHHPIEGETLDEEMKKEKGFDIETFSFGVTNPVNVGSGSSGLGSGRAEFEKFSFTKRTDTATCATVLSCCAGTHHKSFTLIIRKGGASSTLAGGEYVRVTLTDVVIESITWEGSDGDEAFSDNITLAYAEIKIEYKEQDMKGVLKPASGLKGSMGWSQVKNKVAG